MSPSSWLPFLPKIGSHRAGFPSKTTVSPLAMGQLRTVERRTWPSPTGLLQGSGWRDVCVRSRAAAGLCSCAEVWFVTLT